MQRMATKFILICLVLFFSLTTVAYAKESGFYLDASVGMTDINESGWDDSTSFSLGAGFSINKYIATEARYIDFGEFDDDIDPVWTISGDAFVFNIVGKYPVTDRFSVFSKIGFFAWDVELSEKGFGELASDDGTDITYGVGVAFNITDNFTSYLQFQRYDFDVDGEDVDLDDISIGVQYRF